MNLDDMKKDWQRRSDELAGERFDRLAQQIMARSTKFEATITRRDWIEAGAAAVVLIWFGLFLRFESVPFIAALGVVIIMLGCVEIVVVLFWTRRLDARPRRDASLLEFSKAELTRVDRQIRLLRNVSWWYSTPVLVGCVVFIFGLLGSMPLSPWWMAWVFYLSFLLCFFLAGFVVHRINQRAVNNNLLPLRAEIVDSIDALLEGDTQPDE